MTAPALDAFLRDAAAALGAEAVERAEPVLARYGAHTLPVEDRPPAGVVLPGSCADVQALVRLANGHRVPLHPVSTGRSIGLGDRAPLAPGHVVVHLARRMHRVLEVDEDLGYAVVEPGVTFTALHEELGRRGSALMISPTAGPPDGSVLANALDKGGGSGAAGDHFGNLCGMEVVLGAGEVLRTGDAGLDAPAHPGWHASKYSFGPALEGLFTQSNFGIVTRAGVWLMRRPAAIRGFFFAYPDDADLGEIIERIRPLKQAGAVPTLIRATNDLYLLASQEPHPEYATTGGRRALSEAGRAALRARHGGVGAWMVSGALYGADPAGFGPALDRLRAHFGPRARYIPEEEARAMPPLRTALDSNAGLPAAGELGMLRWRPGGGAIWLTPGAPMRGPMVGRLREACHRIAESHGLEHMASWVCGARFARGIHAILYNREDAAEAARADACYRAMSDAFAAEGLFVGRAPTAYQDYHHALRTPAVREALAVIKRALDPNGILAPGRYGMG